MLLIVNLIIKIIKYRIKFTSIKHKYIVSH